MARCEDFPCCGHEAGCCPDYDESGRQMNMKCVCGAKLPVNARFSICAGCMRDPDDYGDEDYAHGDSDLRDEESPEYFDHDYQDE
jgi:hypothetical protein